MFADWSAAPDCQSTVADSGTGDALAKRLDRVDATATSPKASVTQAWADFEAAITGRRAAEDGDKRRQ